MSNRVAPLTFNERQLFELVHRRANISRSEISEITGLTPTTVSRLVSGLVEIGLLSEKADRAGQLGQPRKNLAVRAGQAFSVGVNFMRGRFDLAIVDIAGNIVFTDQVDIDDVTPEGIAHLAADRLDAGVEMSGIDRGRIVGAGFSLPGGFSQDGETLLAHSHFPDFHEQKLAPLFADALDLRCSVDTDGACAALGEYLYGHGAGYDTFFLVHIGHGVGGGAIIQGKLFRGAHGNASKPGVLFPYGTPRPSGQDLVETLVKAGIEIEDIAEIPEVVARAGEAVEAWIDRASEQLATLGRVITAFLDPEIIIIGGRLPHRMNQRLVDTLSGKSLPGPSRGLTNAPFAASRLGPDSGVLGAASLPVFSFFFPGSRQTSGNAYVDGRRRSEHQTS
ncbi:ROK family transcriptional regulator [Oricola sp.]|uniref:ROK family transcriptional regulator n=1 Tax=Oricola sp. TaxID=1979950 RepID=UPI0025E38EFF|nr:ROK family transcriptional regulator [Oricola sp.]MCI5077938.1 ROK family transcriptional regulator [Oricola sp.]